MALEGNISEFSLPEILQLIASQRKTGVLALEHDGDEAALDFEDGAITGGYYRHKGLQKHLSEYLFQSNLVSADHLAAADEQHAKDQTPVEEFLIERGHLSKEDFEEAIRFKIQEILDEVFTWLDGHYTFDVKTKLYARTKYPVLLSCDGFLLEGMRRLDEWLRIRKIVPDLAVVIKRTAAPAENLGPEQEKLLEFLGGRHLAVSQLVELTGLGKFVTAQSAAELVELGVVRIVSDERPAEPQPAAALPDISSQTTALAFMIKQWGLLVRYITQYPFNNPAILSCLEEFFTIFNGLAIDAAGLTFEHRDYQMHINGRPLAVPDELLNQFGLYLDLFRIRKLTLLPQLKGDELISFSFLLALPPDIVEAAGGAERAAKGMRLQHIRAEIATVSYDAAFKGEKIFDIPSRFLSFIDEMPGLAPQKNKQEHVQASLRKVLRIPQPRIFPPDLLDIEEVEHLSNKLLGVYARSGRDKYIEKLVQCVMKLRPTVRLSYIKRKVMDVRWLFPIDNIVALSQAQFEKLG
ncbi:MAG TPA: DUF4388 domain-containing protein [Candidatus Edwardsbacteria bacterium]|nr:DUF4388 domain-containing protein [Candidatus Edwardsbacteria bacterium]